MLNIAFVYLIFPSEYPYKVFKVYISDIIRFSESSVLCPDLSVFALSNIPTISNSYSSGDIEDTL